jgi:hypothetical protein
LEKSRLRRFFRDPTRLPAAKGATFAAWSFLHGMLPLAATPCGERFASFAATRIQIIGGNIELT